MICYISIGDILIHFIISVNTTIAFALYFHIFHLETCVDASASSKGHKYIFSVTNTLKAYFILTFVADHYALFTCIDIKV
jgi:hypothetical protein